MKKKLTIMGVCVLILLLVFAVNIYKRVKNDGGGNTKQELILRVGDMMTIPEAVRLIKYLGIDENKLPVEISKGSSTKEKTAKEETSKEETSKENNSNEEVSNDEASKAQSEAGVSTESTDALQYLSFGDCSNLFKFICKELNIDSDKILKNINLDIKAEQSNKVILTEEFLRLYEGILAQMPKESNPVSEKTMYILGSLNKNAVDSTDTNAKSVMVTNEGEFTYDNATSYERLYTNELQNSEFHLENYIDRKVTAMVCGSELIYIKSVLTDETILHNVWISEASGGKVSTFLYNISKDFSVHSNLSQTIKNKIGDLTIEDGKIVKLSIKPDIIKGKVLVANDDYIELDGYGKVPLDENYKIYKIYDELSMEVTNSILVGYDSTDFVVANGKIVAALIKESINAQNIRVLLKTNNYENIFHKEVKITANRDFTVTIGKNIKNYKKGEKLTFNFSDLTLNNERISIKTKSENGKIKILSLNRTCGNPSYRGTIEIVKAQEGLIVINELSIEEYLYAVIPSEMPSSYGLEALKVQAICARSYAYNQLFANGYSKYGAHVDDSVAYQVYNNIAEDKNSILAVKDTYGKVIQYNKAVISAYYFSTSCGHTASMEEVWANATTADYLVGKLQTIDTTKKTKIGKSLMVASVKNQDSTDFSSESEFRNFILKPEKNTYDTSFPWYRWKVTVSLEDLTKSINQNLSERYNANPSLIQTLLSKGLGRKKEYESVPVSTIGTLKSIKIGKREKSGILSEIILVGSEDTVKVSTEYNIRALLAPINDVVIRQDKSTAEGLSMLPSAFFIIDKKGKNITLTGGGYGHGVGLSQNGAKAMADLGIGYESIIKHFYTGVDIGFIY